MNRSENHFNTSSKKAPTQSLTWWLHFVGPFTLIFLVLVGSIFIIQTIQFVHWTNKPQNLKVSFLFHDKKPHDWSLVKSQINNTTHEHCVSGKAPNGLKWGPPTHRRQITPKGSKYLWISSAQISMRETLRDQWIRTPWKTKRDILGITVSLHYTNVAIQNFKVLHKCDLGNTKCASRVFSPIFRI